MSDIKTRNYVNKPLDEMSAEELRHGALKWMTNEAEGEGLGDARASIGGERSAARSEPKVGKKALKARIAALEAQIGGGSR
jgi:hypothetical protein